MSQLLLVNDKAVYLTHHKLLLILVIFLLLHFLSLDFGNFFGKLLVHLFLTSKLAILLLQLHFFVCHLRLVLCVQLYLALPDSLLNARLDFVRFRTFLLGLLQLVIHLAEFTLLRFLLIF